MATTITNRDLIAGANGSIKSPQSDISFRKKKNSFHILETETILTEQQPVTLHKMMIVRNHYSNINIVSDRFSVVFIFTVKTSLVFLCSTRKFDSFRNLSK